MPLKLSPASHIDHNIPTAAMAWILDQFKEREAFFIASVELPEDLGEVPCGLHGPIVGDEPVSETEVRYERRNGRAWESRVCSRPTRPTRVVTVIGGPHETEACILYTAFGGPLATKEPGDPTVTPEQLDFNQKFWAEHALSAS